MATAPPAAPKKKGLASAQKNVMVVVNNLTSKWALKNPTFGAMSNTFSSKEHVLWDLWFKRQVLCCFQNTKTSANTRADKMGMGQHSDVQGNLLLDKDDHRYNVTDAHWSLRCHFGDILRIQTNTHLVLYVKLNTSATDVGQISH